MTVMLISKINSKEIFELEGFLHKVDKDFEPSLSSRVDIGSYAKKLTDRAIIFKASKGSKTVGLVACYANDPDKINAYIPLIAVDREFYGYGIGSMLLTQLISELKLNSFKELSLTVRKSSEAFHLYKKFGFKIDSEFQYENSEIIGLNMVKNI